MAYLDENGLSKVWEKVKGLTSSSGGSATVLYDNKSGIVISINNQTTVTLSQSVNNFKVTFILVLTSDGYNISAVLLNLSGYNYVPLNGSGLRALLSNNVLNIQNTSPYEIRLYKVLGV